MGRREIVKVKSTAGTNLTGWQQYVRETDVDKTTHNFRVSRKYHSEVGIDGQHYDFYEIDRHNTTVDTTKQVRGQQGQDRANLDYIAMMTDIDLPEEDKNGTLEEV